MNSGYFYCPYVPLNDDDGGRDYAANEEHPNKDFFYNIGEEVWVYGSSEQSIGYPPWRAKITKRWYEEDMEKIHKYSPYWFVVEPIDDPPYHRQKGTNWPIIVGEGEIRRYE